MYDLILQLSNNPRVGINHFWELERNYQVKRPRRESKLE